MANPPTQQPGSPSRTPAVRAMIAIAVAVHFLQWVTFDLRSYLGFRAEGVAHGWWRIATFPFVHANLWQLALVVLVLGAFGAPLERAWGTRRFVWFWYWCSLGAVLGAILAAPGTLLLGGSAAALGLLYAGAHRAPRSELLIAGALPARVRTAAAVLALLIVVVGVTSGRGEVGLDPAFLVQLGGALFAALYFRAPDAAAMDRLHQHVAPVPDVPDEPPRAIPRSQPRTRERGDQVDEIVARSKAITAGRPAPAPPHPSTEPHPEEINRVLDKISALGLESLTPEERALLDSHSRRLRNE